jgi:hypothetical protein
VDVEKYVGNGVYTQMTPITGVPVNGDGSWSARYPTPLGDAQYVWRVAQGDSAGNQGTSANREFTVDTTAPTVSIGQPIDGSSWPLSGFQQRLSGLAGRAVGDDATITVAVFSFPIGSPAKYLTTLTTQATGQTADGAHAYWALDLTGTSALPQGRYKAIADQRDDAGNIRETSSIWTILPNGSKPVIVPPPVPGPPVDHLVITGGGGTVGGGVQNPTKGSTVDAIIDGRQCRPGGTCIDPTCPSGLYDLIGPPVGCTNPASSTDNVTANAARFRRAAVLGRTVIRKAPKGRVKFTVQLTKAAKKALHGTIRVELIVLIVPPHGRTMITIKRITLHLKSHR